MEKIKTGKIVNAVGLKGELKLYNYSRPDRYEDLDQILIGDRLYCIENVRYQKDMVILKVEGVDDRNAAEAVKGKDVYISEEDLDELSEGEYYIKDIIGFDVMDEAGNVLGKLDDIIQGTAQELFCIKPEKGKMIYLPVVDEFIRGVDTDKKEIKVQLPEGLLEI